MPGHEQSKASQRLISGTYTKTQIVAIEIHQSFNPMSILKQFLNQQQNFYEYKVEKYAASGFILNIW